MFITGSARGIGYGLAKSFLEPGSTVTVNGRKQDAVDIAVADLKSRFDAGQVLGLACDVTDPV